MDPLDEQVYELKPDDRELPFFGCPDEKMIVHGNASGKIICLCPSCHGLVEVDFDTMTSYPYAGEDRDELLADIMKDLED